MNHQKFHKDYGDLVICADDGNYWRKDVFPYYKAGRKEARAESEINWNDVFKSFNNIRDELKEFLPYKVIQIPRAEADDIIGVITHAEGNPLNSGEKVLVLSGDKDYLQLHTHGNVYQYDPVRKKYITTGDADAYLKEHILRGDKGDGIPNVLSQDDTFVLNIRQKQLRQTKIEKWDSGELVMDDETVRNWHRNKALIDLNQVPDSIKDQILEAHNTENTKDRSKLLTYFISKRLKHLMPHIPEF